MGCILTVARPRQLSHAYDYAEGPMFIIFANGALKDKLLESMGITLQYFHQELPWNFQRASFRFAWLEESKMSIDRNVDDQEIPCDDVVALCLAEIAHYLSVGLKISFGAAIDMMNSTDIVPFTLNLSSNTKQWIDQDAESAAIAIANKAGHSISLDESMRHLVSLFQ